MKNINFNMGRYYAWQNLTKYIKSFYKQYFKPIQTYQFVYIPPTVHPRFQYLPYHQWKAVKNRRDGFFKYSMIALGFLSYLFGRFVYRVLEDEEMGYVYHVKYPIVSKSIQLISEDVNEYLNPFFDIIPKDRYQVGRIYPKLYQLLFKTQQKKIEHDKKALELKIAMEQYDKKVKQG